MQYDRTRVQVGDKVRDNQTLEEGVVVDLRAVSDWLTVAVIAIAGTSIMKHYQVMRPLKPGPAGQLELELVNVPLDVRNTGEAVADSAAHSVRSNLKPSSISGMEPGFEKLASYVDANYTATIGTVQKDDVLRLLREANSSGMNGRSTTMFTHVDDIIQLVQLTGIGKYDEEVVNEACRIVRQQQSLLRDFITASGPESFDSVTRVNGIGVVDSVERRRELLARKSQAVEQLNIAYESGQDARVHAAQAKLDGIDKQLVNLDRADARGRVNAISQFNDSYGRLNAQRERLKKRFIAEQAKNINSGVAQRIQTELHSVESQMYSVLYREKSKAVLLIGDEYDRLGIRRTVAKDSAARLREQMFDIRSASNTMRYQGRKIRWQRGLTDEMESALTVAARSGGHQEVAAVKRALRTGDYTTAAELVEELGSNILAKQGRVRIEGGVVKTYGALEEQHQRFRLANQRAKKQAAAMKTKAILQRNHLILDEINRLRYERRERWRNTYMLHNKVYTRNKAYYKADRARKGAIRDSKRQAWLSGANASDKNFWFDIESVMPMDEALNSELQDAIAEYNRVEGQLGRAKSTGSMQKLTSELGRLEKKIARLESDIEKHALKASYLPSPGDFAEQEYDRFEQAWRAAQNDSMAQRFDFPDYLQAAKEGRPVVSSNVQSQINAYKFWTGKDPTTGHVVQTHSARTILDYGGEISVVQNGMRFKIEGYINRSGGKVSTTINSGEHIDPVREIQFIARPESVANADQFEVMLNRTWAGQGDITDNFAAQVLASLEANSAYTDSDTARVAKFDYIQAQLDAQRIKRSTKRGTGSLTELLNSIKNPDISYSHSSVFNPMDVIVDGDTIRVNTIDELLAYAMRNKQFRVPADMAHMDDMGMSNRLFYYLREQVKKSSALRGMVHDVDTAAEDIASLAAMEISDTISGMRAEKAVPIDELFDTAIGKVLRKKSFWRWTQDLGIGKSENNMLKLSLADIMLRHGKDGSDYELELALQGGHITDPTFDAVSEKFTRQLYSEETTALMDQLPTFAKLYADNRIRVTNGPSGARLHFVDAPARQVSNEVSIAKLRDELAVQEASYAHELQSGDPGARYRLDKIERLKSQISNLDSGGAMLAESALDRSATASFGELEKLRAEILGTNNRELIEMFGLREYQANGEFFEKDFRLHHTPSGNVVTRAGRNFVIDDRGNMTYVSGVPDPSGVEVPAELQNILSDDRVVLSFDALGNREYGINTNPLVTHNYKIDRTSHMYRLPDGNYISAREAGVLDFRQHVEEIKRVAQSQQSSKVYVLDLEWGNQFEGGGIKEVGLAEYSNTERGLRIMNDLSNDITLTQTGQAKLDKLDVEAIKNDLRRKGISDAEMSSELYREIGERTSKIVNGNARTEGAMLKRVARTLKADPDATILTHNKAADLPKLIERAEALGDSASAAVFREAYQRNADVMLMSQLFDINLPGKHNLQNMSRVAGILGDTQFQSHHNIVSAAERRLGVKSDIDLTAGVYNYIAHGGGATKFHNNLSGLDLSPLEVTGQESFVWRVQSRQSGQRRRGYRVLGFTRVGEGAEQNAAIAMQPVIGTRDGVPVFGETEFFSAVSEKELGPRFVGEFIPVENASKLADMQDYAVEDLAGRRVRAAMFDVDYAYDELGRLEAARQALNTGSLDISKPSVLDFATESMSEDEIAEHYTHLRSEWARQQSYAWDYLYDPRLQQQIAGKEAAWLEGEFQHLHRPFFDKLRNRSDLTHAEIQNLLRRWHAKVDQVAGVSVRQRNVPLYERQIAFNIEELGEHPVGMSAYSEEAFESSKSNVADRLARKADKRRISELLGDLASSENIDEFVATRKMETLSDAARERLRAGFWQNEISNALRNNLSEHAAHLLGQTELPTDLDELQYSLINFASGDTVTAEDLARLTNAEYRDYLEDRWSVLKDDESARNQLRSFSEELLGTVNGPTSEINSFSYTGSALNESSNMTLDELTKAPMEHSKPGTAIVPAERYPLSNEQQLLNMFETLSDQRMAGADTIDDVLDVVVPRGRYRGQTVGSLGRPALEEIAHGMGGNFTDDFRSGVQSVLIGSGPASMPFTAQQAEVKHRVINAGLDAAEDALSHAWSNRTFRVISIGAATAGAMFTARKPNLDTDRENTSPQTQFDQDIHHTERPLHHRIVATIMGESGEESADVPSINASVQQAVQSYIKGGVETTSTSSQDSRSSFNRLLVENIQDKLSGYGDLLE